MKNKIFLVLVCTGLLSGCATIISGGSQTINVQALDSNTHNLLPNTSCLVTDGRGNNYTVMGNPGTVVVPTGYGAINVNCTKLGYTQTQVGRGQSFNAWVIADVLFWPGAIVDAATGAAVKYPSHITVLMSKGSKK
jgi:uncharacterized protein YceK